MALSTIIVGLMACCLIGGGIAYGELRAWQGARLGGLYVVAGLMASELVAAPIMWELFALRSGWVESLAMATALGVGLATIVRLLPAVQP